MSFITGHNRQLFRARLTNPELIRGNFNLRPDPAKDLPQEFDLQRVTDTSLFLGFLC